MGTESNELIHNQHAPNHWRRSYPPRRSRGDNSRGNRGNNGGNKRRGQRINFAFLCDPHQRVKSKTSWCSYLLYNRKISEYLKIKIEKAQIHSILKNLSPSTIFKNVQMTIPPCLLDQ